MEYSLHCLLVGSAPIHGSTSGERREHSKGSKIAMVPCAEENAVSGPNGIFSTPHGVVSRYDGEQSRGIWSN